MASGDHSFIDIAVHDEVRTHFAAGDALVVLDAALAEVIWANGPGAALFDAGDIGALIGAAPPLATVAKRQIMAISGYPDIGRDRGLMVRMTQGLSSRAVLFRATGLTLPGGEKAILLAASVEGDNIAQRVISGMSQPGQFVALVGKDGAIEAGSPGFAKLGVTGDTLAQLVADASGARGRLVKRMIPAGGRRLPAGLARLTDDAHLLIIVDENWAEPANEAAAAEPIVPAEAAASAEAVAAPAQPESITPAAEADAPTEAGPEAPDMPAGAGQAFIHTPSDATTSMAETLFEDELALAMSAAEAAGSDVAPEPRQASAPPPAPVATPEAPAGDVAPDDPAPVDAIAPSAENASAPVRFVWRTDAEGRFSALSPEFAGAVGGPAAGVIGHGFRDVCKVFGMDVDGEIAGLLERRDTWSGRSLLWPVAGTDLRIPVDLAALPVYDRSRNFEGFRGFGVARVGDAMVDPEATGLSLIDEAAAPAPDALPLDALSADAGKPDPFQGEPPVLSIVPKQERRFADKVIRLAEHRTPANDRGLTPVERTAFREIGDTLRPAEGQSEAAPEQAAETSASPPATNRLPDRPEPPAQFDIATSMARVAAALADITGAAANNAAQQPPAAADAPAEIPAAPAEASAEALEAPVDLPSEPVAPAEPPISETVMADEPAEPAAEAPAVPTGEPAASEPGPMQATPRSRRHSSLLGWVEDEAATDARASGAVGASEMIDVVAHASKPVASEPDGSQPAPEQTSALDAIMPGTPDGPVPGTPLFEAIAAEIVADEEVAPPAPQNEAPAPADSADAPEAIGRAEPVLAEPAADESISQVAAIAQAVKQAEPAEPVEEDSELAAFGLTPRRPPVDTSILDRLPIPVLIHSGDELHYANDEFLEFTAYDSIAELAARGGLGELFAEPYPAEGEDGDRKLRLRRGDDLELPVEAFLQSVPWHGGKALLLSLRRIGRAPLPIPAQAPAAPLKSEERQALEALITELGAIVDTATDGVILIGENGVIRSISRPAEALFGFDSADVAGKPFVSLFAIESQRTAKDYLNSLSDHGVKSVLNDGREVIGREAQGRFIPLFMTIGRLPNRNGYCAVLRDITQWKRAEEDLTQARSQAERASSQKTEFLARVSHEIRTPLNAIIGFSELMMDEKFGPIGNERYRDYLRDINRSGNHVLDLVNDLLDISKIEAGQQEMAYEAVALNDTLSESVALMQPQANRERVIIRSSFASGLPDVVADLRTIRQIALNLLSNAIRYTQAGGQVIVSTAYETSGDVIMRVRDTGIGMSPAEIEQALKPFKQINAIKRPRGDGTGLGLPLTKAMVEANRARFSITSTPGEGTLVEITFPSTRVLAA